MHLMSTESLCLLLLHSAATLIPFSAILSSKKSIPLPHVPVGLSTCPCFCFCICICSVQFRSPISLSDSDYLTSPSPSLLLLVQFLCRHSKISPLFAFQIWLANTRLSRFFALRLQLNPLINHLYSICYLQFLVALVSDKKDVHNFIGEQEADLRQDLIQSLRTYPS